MLSKSRFNPKTGVLDFWHEFRKPNPYRWPMMIAAAAPFGLIFYWLSSETVYKDPERPSITYVTTLDEGRTDEEIIASNIENQEVNDLREAQEAQLAQRKRDIYKALGSAIGMDVEEIERRADAERAAEEAADQARRDELFGRTGDAESENGDIGSVSAGAGAAP